MSIQRARKNILEYTTTEIFLGHNAIGVYIAISDHASRLNASSFSQVFGTIQRHAFDAFILSLCKLYERPSQRYPNSSIPTTLELLRKNPSELTSGIQNYVQPERYIQAHIDETFVVSGDDDTKRIPGLILDHFSEHCPQTPPRNGKQLDFILDALKVLRDKRVAHHENTDLSLLTKTNLDGAIRLLAFAQTVVNLVGYGFFGYSRDAEVGVGCFHPQECEVWSSMKELIKGLEKTD